MGRTWLFIGLSGAFFVAAGVSHYAKATDLLTFGLSTVALAGLAWVVSFATEQVGERFGPAVTGVLQSTLGNLPEFFVVLFALSAGEVVVAETSIVGSVFANALLVLGIVIFVGCGPTEDGVMRFSVRLPKDNAILMMLASFLIVILGISTATGDKASHHIEAISIAGRLPYSRPTSSGSSTTSARTRRRSRRTSSRSCRCGGRSCCSRSAASGRRSSRTGSSTALAPSMDRLGIPEAFAGLVIVAIAGNAVENFAGIALAMKGQADLAISVVKNSVAQITAFLYPALVLVSLLFATRLTFALPPVLIAALLLTGLALWMITSDGEATRFEGVALVAFYGILAVAVWFE